MDARYPTGRLGRAAAVAAAGGGLLAIAISLPGSAADPFVAGQPAARSLPLEEGGRAAIVAADRLTSALALPPAIGRSVERLRDRIESATYDEVTLRDERGRPTVIVRLRLDGSLRHLVRLGLPAPGARPIAAGDVAGRAHAVAALAGLAPAGGPVIGTDPTGGWTAAWTRTVGGIPVAGDGIWVRLGVDGSVRSVARTESPLAGPAVPGLDEAQARQAAERLLDARMTADARRETHVASARLEWVAPNDTFESSRPDAPEPVRRLAWVVRAVPSGALAERLRGLELQVDATTGALLGGDVLE